MESTYVIIICFAIFLFSLLVIILVYNKHLNQKKIEIKELTKKLDNVNEKLKERRKTWRLKTDEECEFQILKIGNKNINLIKERKGLGIIKDISFTGLRLESVYDLPVKDNVEIKLEFVFDNHELELEGLIIRKEEHIHNENYLYGVKLIETDIKTQNEFNQLIRDREIEDRRKRSENF